MAEITVEESWRQIRTLIDRAEQAAAEGRPDEAVERWQAVLAHPCAHHQLAAYEILDEIHRAYREAGHYEDAIAAKHEAIAAGYRSVPDREADIAECLLAAGRHEEADALFAALRERDPEDVWLYNAAAYSYADVDVTMSLQWALDGIEVALTTGDPDQVVMQLLEAAEDAWKQLGEPVDRQLVETVERFCDEWTRLPSRRPWGDAPPLEDRACVHCGYQPDISRAEQDDRARRNRRRRLETEMPDAPLARLDGLGDSEPKVKRSGPVDLAFGWFPSVEWAEACQRWPDLLDDLPADHLAQGLAAPARVAAVAAAGGSGAVPEGPGAAARGLAGAAVTGPSEETGRARYFALQRLARQQGRDTQELLTLYALEGLLARLAASDHREQLMVKGGMLLAAFAPRRPTRDVDVHTQQLESDVETVRDLIVDVAALDLDDGLAYDTSGATARVIRGDHQYSGVRVTLTVDLHTAKLSVKVDVNVGDPIWPAPEDVTLPRLLTDEPLILRGYPLHMVLAEKLFTAIDRGTANTRWRDFADI